MNNILPRPHRAPRQISPLFYACEISYPAGADARESRFTQWVCALTLGGSCRYLCGGRESTLFPASFLLVRPAVVMKWQALHEGWHVVYCVFHPRPHWLAWLQFPGGEQEFQLLHLDSARLFGKLRRMLLASHKTYIGGSAQREAMAMLMLERALLALHEHQAEESTDPRVTSAMELLNAEYARPWTVDELAAACRTSASRLSFHFQQSAGVAPMQYLEQVRLQRAMELLALGRDSIGEIARAIGYDYPHYFARRFRLFTGQTPLEYRKQSRTAPR